MVKEIPLKNGMVALVDDEDFERINQYKWNVRVNKTTYAIQRTCYEKGTPKSIKLSNAILSVDTKTEVVIFLDGNGLNHQKSNLKIIPRSMMNHYKRGNKKSSSKYKGVHWDKRENKWRAQIQQNGKCIRLGSYTSEEKAALAYNRAALEYFGEHAFQNVINEDNSAKKLPAIQVEKTSKYRGVSWRKKEQSFVAVCNRKWIGAFEDETDAAKAYDKKAYELLGDKAILNFPEDYKSDS